MKLFTGTETYPVHAESEDPGVASTLIYYLGDVSDQWLNFVNISLNKNVYQQRISRFGNVKEI